MAALKPALKEADLCAAFIAAATNPGHWTAYAETAGFDILLSRNSDGVQIGIEAKLALNAKVICQILPERWGHGTTGPNYRAVLIPRDVPYALQPVCKALGITVLRHGMDPKEHFTFERFTPDLPWREHLWDDYDWHEWAPLHPCKLPDYVPDVAAGSPCPLTLSIWKIKAIKLAIILASRPVTRADFKAIGLDPRRWTDPFTGWLKRGDCGGYVAGPQIPDFKRQHPENWKQIEADKRNWMPMLTAPAEPRLRRKAA